MVDLAIETAEIPLIGGTTYAGFAVRAHAALLESAQADDCEVLVHAQQSAIVARLATGEPIGILTFNKQEQSNSIFVFIAFVVPDFRRRGVFRLMNEELVKSAERLGASRIEMVSSVGNASFNLVATASGYRVVAQVYRQDLDG